MVHLVGQSFFRSSQLSTFSKNGPFWRLVRDNHFLRKWSEEPFPREDSFSPGCTMISAEGMAQLGEWSRFNNQGHEFPRAYSFSPGCTMISVRGMAQ
jgi:hypothetical protein